MASNHITDGQMFALNKLIERFTGKDREARLWVISKLIDREIESTADLWLAEWQTIRNWAYPDWVNDNWEVSEQFASECAVLVLRFNEEVRGQLRLF